MNERQRLEILFDVLHDAKKAHLAAYKRESGDSERLVWYQTYDAILDGLKAISRQLGGSAWVS